MVKGLCSAAGVCMWVYPTEEAVGAGRSSWSEQLSSQACPAHDQVCSAAAADDEGISQQDSSDQEHADLMVGYTYTTQPHNRSSELTGHKGGQWG